MDPMFFSYYRTEVRNSSVVLMMIFKLCIRDGLKSFYMPNQCQQNRRFVYSTLVIYVRFFGRVTTCVSHIRQQCFSNSFVFILYCIVDNVVSGNVLGAT